jgi:hypothetical protein
MRVLGIAGWGLFCASSWAWCIGMYLPVSLIREFGWPGFAAFAIPNVLGCVAFGYVLATRAASEEMVRRHQVAMRSFSLVAIAYQSFFAAFLATAFLGPAQRAPWLGVLLAGIVVAAGLLVSTLPHRAWPYVGAGVYAISLATVFGLDLGSLGTIGPLGVRPAGELAWFVPVMVFGFGLCPYLDLTFHRALRASGSPHTFLVFGVAFGPMVLLTCLYRDRLAAWALVPLVHIGVQLVFTIAAHVREHAEMGRGIALRYGGALATGLLGGAAILFAGAGPGAAGGPPGEDTYLRFLVFFALIFPAYVLLFVGPGRALALRRRNLIAFAFAMVASLPLFELGFFGGRPGLLVVPLIGLLAVRIVIAGVSTGNGDAGVA